MAKKILTGTPDSNNQNGSKPALLYQDTALLAELFQLSHEYYQKRSLWDERAFIYFLKGFIEPIEAVCQQNPALSLDYYCDSTEFHRYLLNDFWQTAETLEPFFHAITCLVQHGVESFRVQGYPESYSTFLHQLGQIFENEVIIQSGKQRTAHLLLVQLRQKPD